jgi:hypothetical protein
MRVTLEPMNKSGQTLEIHQVIYSLVLEEDNNQGKVHPTSWHTNQV